MAYDAQNKLRLYTLFSYYVTMITPSFIRIYHLLLRGIVIFCRKAKIVQGWHAHPNAQRKVAYMVGPVKYSPTITSTRWWYLVTYISTLIRWATHLHRDNFCTCSCWRNLAHGNRFWKLFPTRLPPFSATTSATPRTIVIIFGCNSLFKSGRRLLPNLPTDFKALWYVLTAAVQRFNPAGNLRVK